MYSPQSFQLLVRASETGPAGSQPVEVVERKGIGHPDTICDALAEQASLALCRYYLERYGRILHHNVDKILLCGGVARPAFGGGEVLEPIEIYLAGRVTAEREVTELAVEACRAWLARHLPELDVKRHVRFFPRFHHTSGALEDLFSRSVPLCNDTACGVGFAPLSPLESAVFGIERELNSAAVHAAHPAIGSDIKVMAVRRGDRAQFTVACAMIDRHLNGIEQYKDAAATVRRIAEKAAGLGAEVTVNHADDYARGSVYLTVTGTSAEAGDDGEAGRGNRGSGLITPFRPMTIESLCGKNPVSHVGKLYNVTAGTIAGRVASIPGILEATCVLVSQIGRPIDDPQIAEVRVVRERNQNIEDVREAIGDVVREELSHLGDLQYALLEERFVLY